MLTRTQRGRIDPGAGAAPSAASRLVLAAAAAALAGCTQQPVAWSSTDQLTQPTAVTTGTFYGSAVEIGRGTARVYLTMRSGVPEELGVELTEGALLDLHPVAATDAAGHRELELTLPAQAAATPFSHATLGWSPAGHAAPYDRPHLDLRFYLISPEERAAIDPADPAFARRAARLPASRYIPRRYVPQSVLAGIEPARVTMPGAGMRWLDVESPELRGQPFTRTFLYGSWDGAVAFAEAMVALDHLRTKPEITVPLPPAEDFAAPGFHPGAYRVYWHAARGQYRVALAEFAMR
jgi:hypothetical protein